MVLFYDAKVVQCCLWVSLISPFIRVLTPLLGTKLVHYYPALPFK
jgi:hypothetical protein